MMFSTAGFAANLVLLAQEQGDVAPAYADVAPAYIWAGPGYGYAGSIRWHRGDRHLPQW